MLRRLTVLLCLSWVVLAAQENSAQDLSKSATPSPKERNEQEDVPVFRANVRLLLVDVIATANGRAITDLTASDFSIVHNGKRQAVAIFESVGKDGGGQSKPLPRLLIRPGAITNVATEASKAPLTVLLLDSINTVFASQAYARKAFVQATEGLPAGQHVVVFSLGRELRLLLDESGDKKQIAASLEGFPTTHDSSGGTASVGSEPVAGGPTPQRAQGSVGNSSLMVEAALDQVSENLSLLDSGVACDYTQDGLQALARALRRLPGRKKLVWMADAFPLYCNPRGVRTAELFAMARIAIYPVAAGGLATASLTAGDSILVKDRPQEMQKARTAAQAIKTLGMMKLADASGGLHYQSNDLAGSVIRTFSDGTQYYTLGFYANQTTPKLSHHQIQVKSKRSGINLRYRSDYAFQDFESYSSKQRSNEFGAALSPRTPLSMELVFATEVVKQPGGVITLFYRTAADKLRFSIDASGGWEARVDCAAEAYDGRGKLIQQRTQTIESSMTRSTLADVLQVGFPCEVRMELPPGAYALRLGVRDSHTGALGTAEGRVTIP